MGAPDSTLASGSCDESRYSHVDLQMSSFHNDHNHPETRIHVDEPADGNPHLKPGKFVTCVCGTGRAELHRSHECCHQRNEASVERIQEAQTHSSLDRATSHGLHDASSTVTQIYVVSHLILFSLLGTLARLGIQAITFYPGAPVTFNVLWANFGGTVFLGFLAEDRILFRDECEMRVSDHHIKEAREEGCVEERRSTARINKTSLKATTSAHVATKKTIPLYTGLATGFCGCFTSFSSFIRDTFLALSNTQPVPPELVPPTTPRNGGFSFLALLAVVIVTISACMSGFYLGTHVALALQAYLIPISTKLLRKLIDRVVVLLAVGCWLGAIILAVFPPDRNEQAAENWRGRAVFALVFAPLGCLGRYYASIYLNGRVGVFPLGTFAVNILGTAVLGLSYDLQRVPLGGVIGCQILQGIQDGFCGCLTTVSTWVAEMSTLRRRPSYIYGGTSVVVALGFLIVITGTFQWTRGFADLQCSH